jgi:thiol-disulfide isomerase/thioredoxin
MGPSLVPLPPGLPATLPYAGGQRPAALRLADLPHAPTVIAFTASWCTPCRKQTAELDRLRRRGVAVLQVGFEDKAADLARAPGPPLRVTDPGGKLATAFGVRAIPATIALDASKRILARRVGPVDAAWTDDYLAAVLPRQRDLLQALTP